MNKETGKQEPESKPDHQNDSEQSEKSGGRKGISRVSRALVCVGLFGFLAAWAGLFGNLGHRFWIFAASLMLVATPLLAFGLRWELRNHHWLKWQYNGLFWAVLVMGFGMGVPVIVRELSRREPKPHMLLYLKTSASPDSILMFTNDFLFVKVPVVSPSDLPNRLAQLIVRVPAEKTNVALNFGLLNDSASQWDTVDDSALTIDSPFLEFAIFESGKAGKLEWKADPIWRQRRLSKDDLLHCDLPSLLAGQGCVSSGGSIGVLWCAVSVVGRGVQGEQGRQRLPNSSRVQWFAWLAAQCKRGDERSSE